MKHLGKTIFLLCICTALVFSICACQPQQDNPDVTPTPQDISQTPAPTSAETPTPAEDPEKIAREKAQYDAIAAANALSPADKVAVRETLGWWDNWARFSSVGSGIGAFDINADTTGTVVCDEGRGPFFREYIAVEQNVAGTIEAAKTLGIKTGAWIECQGDTNNFIFGIHQNEDGSFEQSEYVEGPKIYANSWNWAMSSPRNNPVINKVVFGGVHSFVNGEDWLGKYVISSYPEMALPTYPDGASAIGYLDGGDYSTPQLAKLYDACGAKSIRGDVFRIEELSNYDGDTTGTIHIVAQNGLEYYTLGLGIGKDSAAPFWNEYARNAVEYLLGLGVDYFWIDNWNGWDNFSNTPNNRIFGDWSEAMFNEYLLAHPEIGFTPDENFNIREYLCEKASEIDPQFDLVFDNTNSMTWRDPSWLSDPLWMAYIAFKAQSNCKYSSELFTIIKETAEKLGRDGDDIAVCANDFPYLIYGAFEGETLDMVHTEYNATYSAVTGFTTAGYPPNGYSGHVYSLLANTARSKNGNVWYYAEGYERNKNLGYVLAYEALAYNCTITLGDGMTSVAGTNNTTTKVFDVIGKLKNDFADRGTYAEIGVMYSSDSEMSQITPGGFVTSEKNATTLSYMGWCHAFDELNIPYRSLHEFRLEQTIDLLNVLILPNVRSMDKDVIDGILMPFLDRGGVLIITGDEAGIIGSVDSSYIYNGSALLVDLANTYSGNGKIIYYESDPTMDYMIYHKKYDRESLDEFFLNDIASLINGLYDEGKLNKLLSVENLPDSVITTLNYAPSNETLFVDIVNMQLDLESDELTKIDAGVKTTVRMPNTLWGKEDISVRLMDSATRKFVELTAGTDFTVNGAYIEITFPEIDVYMTAIINAK